jgi:4-aminobutyrate aminotransferase-like enzyme
MRLLGPAYRLFYDRPVEIARGDGTTLYDRTGRAYLDAYNNVVPLGHCHPAVVSAVADQLATLNTNTRYLSEPILSYAEDLLGTFEPGLKVAGGHVMFTCTGSEANDLALRIARHHTGNEGIIITAEAYHGNSELTSGISPSLGAYAKLGTWVRRVPSPDSYRFGGAPREMAAWFAGHVEAAVTELTRHGVGVAALITDSVFSSDGIYPHPAGLLAGAAAVVRDAGGLVIADEVQSGFARTGEAMWGFTRHGVDPDIVTMGKPMGNGFPVAGLVASAQALERFGNDVRYFNTFGGNTVAIAAAQATLDALRAENLQANAATVGATLLAGLRDLTARHASIGDVRGTGLYLGVEVVRDRAAKTPDPQLAAGVVNALRDRGVLISVTGHNASVLKIRPPLVFSHADAGRLLEELDAVLSS